MNLVAGSCITCHKPLQGPPFECADCFHHRVAENMLAVLKGGISAEAQATAEHAFLQRFRNVSASVSGLNFPPNWPFVKPPEPLPPIHEDSWYLENSWPLPDVEIDLPDNVGVDPGFSNGMAHAAEALAFAAGQKLDTLAEALNNAHVALAPAAKAKEKEKEPEASEPPVTADYSQPVRRRICLEVS